MRYIELCYAWIVVIFSSKKKLLHVGQLMNHWGWPFKYLGQYYLSLPNSNEKLRTDKYRWHKSIYNFVSKRNSDYDKLHYHNVIYNKMMTEKEFFEWYYTDHQLPLSEKAFLLLKAIGEAEQKFSNDNVTDK